MNQRVRRLLRVLNAFCPTGKGGGRKNTCGKGAKGGAPTVELVESKSALAKIRKQLGTWGGLRQAVAAEAVLGYELGDGQLLTLNVAGRSEAICNLSEYPGGQIEVNSLASKTTGKQYGRKMLYAVYEMAVKKRAKVSLYSVPGALSFYEANGMKAVDNPGRSVHIPTRMEIDWKAAKRQLQAVSNSTGFKLDEWGEPVDGVFTSYSLTGGSRSRRGGGRGGKLQAT